MTLFTSSDCFKKEREPRETREGPRERRDEYPARSQAPLAVAGTRRNAGEGEQRAAPAERRASSDGWISLSRSPFYCLGIRSIFNTIVCTVLSRGEMQGRIFSCFLRLRGEAASFWIKRLGERKKFIQDKSYKYWIWLSKLDSPRSRIPSAVYLNLLRIRG